jgi:putative resolvase
LRNWSNNDKIITVRSSGGHRRIPEDEIRRLKSGMPRDKVLVYARVSTRAQEENLERQVGRLLTYCVEKGYKVELFKDIGSALNEKRKDYRKLLKRLLDEDVSKVIVEYRDRILRYGFPTFHQWCELLGVEVVVLNDKPDKPYEEEFVEDLISIVTVYAARIHDRRGGRKKK